MKPSLDTGTLPAWNQYFAGLVPAGTYVFAGNSFFIGIAYEIGLDYLVQPYESCTLNRRIFLQSTVCFCGQEFFDLKVTGHWDLTPVFDGNGRDDPHESIKFRPCFNAKTALWRSCNHFF